MNNNTEEKHLKTGDILICSTNRLLGRLIKKVTKSKFSHTAQVIKVHGQALVIEAQRAGVQISDYNMWVKRYNYKYLTVRPDESVTKHYAKFSRKALSKTAQHNYDFKAILIDFPRYIWTGVWKGPKNQDEALIDGKWNCGTYTGWLYGFKEWWKMTPEDVYQKCKESNKFTFL